MREKDPKLTFLILSPGSKYPSVDLFESTTIRPNIPFLATVGNALFHDSDSKQLILTRSLVQRVEKMATIRVRAKQIIQAPLPPLDMGSQDYLFGTS